MPRGQTERRTERQEDRRKKNVDRRTDGKKERITG